MRNKLVELSGDNEMLFADGFDEAIIGYDMNTNKVVYSYDTMIACLMKDMTEEDAIEYMDFNVLGAYVGERTPIYIKQI